MANKNERKPGKTVSSLLAATDELLDAVQQFSDKFTNKGNMFSIKEAIGKEAEVSVAIPAGGTGEVVVVLGNALHNYPARAIKANLEFKRGERILIAELANQTFIVDKAKQS